jgi:hypothetical protein
MDKKILGFNGTITDLKTAKDGGFKIYLSVPETDKENFKALIDWKDKAILVGIELDPEQDKVFGTGQIIGKEPDENIASC